MLLQASLGMDIDATANRVSFNDPRLPDFLDDVTIRQLRVGASRVDLRFERAGDGVDVRVLRGRGTVEVVSGRGMELP
jgi:hypothetical protein